ncbi:hypothetical protein V8E36_009752 [Tilletia maclaganii]
MQLSSFFAAPGHWAGWGRQWNDRTLLQPINFDAIPLGGCAWDIVFRRDPRDDKYNLAYYSVYGEGELERQELKQPINIQFRGGIDSSGRQEYFGHIPDACSTFYTARPNARVFKLYFTHKYNSNNQVGYISPKFY